jgi:pyocin large subunit-like protein
VTPWSNHNRSTGSFRAGSGTTTGAHTPYASETRTTAASPHPARAGRLADLLQADADERWRDYEQLRRSTGGSRTRAQGDAAG